MRDADDGPYAQVVAEARVVKAKMTVARTVDKVGRLQSASDRNNTALYVNGEEADSFHGFSHRIKMRYVAIRIDCSTSDHLRWPRGSPGSSKWKYVSI